LIRIFALLIIFNTLLISSLCAEDFSIARLKYKGGGDWYNDPSVIPNMLMKLSKVTGIRCEKKQRVVSIMDDALFEYPFLFMTGHGNVRFTADEAARLKHYLKNGGFLYADDDYGMDKAFRREIRKIGELKELPYTHKIYNIFYKFKNGLPKIHEHNGKPPRGYGIFVEGKMRGFYTYETNISDGWADKEVHKDPENLREEAFKMGINIILYALTH